jgi:hypothetical protein
MFEPTKRPQSYGALSSLRRGPLWEVCLFAKNTDTRVRFRNIPWKGLHRRHYDLGNSMQRKEQICEYNVSDSGSIASHICVRHGHISIIAPVNKNATICHDSRPTEPTESTVQRTPTLTQGRYASGLMYSSKIFSYSRSLGGN